MYIIRFWFTSLKVAPNGVNWIDQHLLSPCLVHATIQITFIIPYIRICALRVRSTYLKTIWRSDVSWRIAENNEGTLIEKKKKLIVYNILYASDLFFY